MSQHRLIIGTRGSSLALWQTEHVSRLLQDAHHDLDIEVRTIQTLGDRVRDRALSQIGGKGLFVKEIETALLADEIDLAVHSLKDMPTEQPDGLILGAIPERADARDALVVRDSTGGLLELPPGARVGTSSLRRRTQVLAARPDLQVLDLRGNVDTRLRKLGEGQYEAIVLAVAGLVRLGRVEAITQYLSLEDMLPAVGQGALCVEVRAGDDVTQRLVALLDHPPSRQATEAERAFLRRLEGGCQVPIGAYAEVSEGSLHLQGLVAALDGTRLVRSETHGPAAEAAQLGTELGERILASGGEAILAEVRRAS
ncbi:hydroxymethylbilane synthase [Chloroflexota bacterium]